jgi:acyl carrier protein
MPPSLDAGAPAAYLRAARVRLATGRRVAMNAPRVSYESIVEGIARYLAEHLEQAPTEPITATTKLVRDLSLDSIQSFEMIADLEDAYGITIDMERVQAVETVGEIATVVHEAVLATGGGA